MVFINPGSHISPPTEGEGYTNTHARATEYAQEWLDRMRTEGFTDIEMTDTGVEREGRWAFEFRHTITHVVVTLEHHGISDLDVYSRKNFEPRVYWNGSSSSNPVLDDFAAPGFAPVQTFRRQ